ncbi:hypothetical protein F4808DRAFT_464367 [Astrocystis sublimbata]|nr:hypothetical protein F4808DRAFT_464367 [Astrocystis sublimbata]
METTFSDDEKRFALAEMIKVSAMDVPTLVEFIKAHKVEPNWMFMQLPSGRNMSQCVGAVENMFQMNFPPPNVGFVVKRKSLGDLSEHPAKRQAITTSFEPPLAPVRPLQPRPPPPNGYPPVAPIISIPTTSITGKKRGRPSKADKEAQARAIYTRNTEYATIVPAPPAPRTATPTGQPQREYVSSPGYEIAAASGEQPSRVRSRPSAIDSPRQSGSSLLLASPASATGTPRAFPDSMEQIERPNIISQDNKSVPVDSRSPPLAPLLQDQPQTHTHILPRPQGSLVPFQPSPKPQQAYEPYRGPDPIFPDRDRSRNMPDKVSRNPSASPVVSRI